MILSKVNLQSVDLNRREIAYLEAGTPEKILYIVPTNRRVRDLRKQLIRISPDQVVHKMYAETIRSLAQKLVSSRNESVEAADEAITLILFRLALKNTPLDYFKSKKSREIPRGTIERLKYVVDKYKESDIYPEDLRKKFEVLESGVELSKLERDKINDLIKIFDAYQDRLEQSRGIARATGVLPVYDIGDIYKLAKLLTHEVLQNRFRALFPEVVEIRISEFTEFTPPEIVLLDALSVIPDTQLFINLDYDSRNTELYSHLSPAYESFILRGFTKLPEHAEMKIDPFLPALRLSFFNPLRESAVPAWRNHSLYTFSAGDRYDEVVKTARCIKKILLDNTKSTKPRAVAVASHLIDRYSSHVRNIFLQYGIPFNLTDRLPLSSFPPVITVIRLLDVLLDDFSYSSIICSLSSPYFKPKYASLDEIKQVAKKFKILRGFETWENVLLHGISYSDKTNRENTADTLERYKRVLDEIEYLHSLLSPFKKGISAEGFAEELLRLIAKINLHDTMLTIRAEDREANCRALKAFIENIRRFVLLLRYEEGTGLVSSTDQVEFSGVHVESPVVKGVLPIERLVRELKELLKNARISVHERSNYGVLITTLDEIRGLTFDHLFILGLCDGDLPTRFQPQVFFDSDFNRTNEDFHLPSERLLFIQAIASCNGSLYLSHPKKDKKAEFAESQFLIELKRLIDIPELPLQSEIFSYHELYREFAKYPASQRIRAALPEWNSAEDLILFKNREEERVSRPYSDVNYAAYKGYLFENADESLMELNEPLNQENSKSFSTSELEMYALCPFRHFMRYVLKIREEEELTEEEDSRFNGTVFHEILEKFGKIVLSKKWNLFAGGKKLFDEALDALMTCAAEVIRGYEFMPFEVLRSLDRFTGINGKFTDSLLYEFLNIECNGAAKPLSKHLKEVLPIFKGFIPIGSEVDFEQSVELPGGSGSAVKKILRFRGTIDRLDYNELQNHILVTDFKTGNKKYEEKKVSNGIELQLLLYSIIAPLLPALQTEVDKQTNSFQPASLARYFVVKPYPDPDSKKNPVISLLGENRRKKKIETAAQIVENTESLKIEVLHKISEHIENMRKGKFHVTRLAKAGWRPCRNCSYGIVCRFSVSSDTSGSDDSEQE